LGSTDERRTSALSNAIFQLIEPHLYKANPTQANNDRQHLGSYTTITEGVLQELNDESLMVLLEWTAQSLTDIGDEQSLAKVSDTIVGSVPSVSLLILVCLFVCLNVGM